MGAASMRALCVTLTLAGLAGCETPPPTDLTDPTAAAGTAGPAVTAADPPFAERDTTLDVRVLGSGFDAGSQAAFLLDGLAVPGVTTNRTTYRSSKELIANITIAPDAVPDRYDILVTTSRGKKGIGTEKFQVVDVIELGTLGGDRSSAKAVNRSGQIVGGATRMDGTAAGFVWQDGVMRELPMPAGWTAGANDINDAGLVVGTVYDGSVRHGARWIPSGGTWSLHLLPTLTGYSGGVTYVKGVTAAGDVVGSVSNTGSPTRAVLWREGVAYQVNVEGPGIDPANVFVSDISDAGWIAGDVWVNGVRTPFVWRPDGTGAPGRGVTIVLPRYGSGVHFGEAVNSAGVVVGWVSGRRWVALRWTPLRPDPVASTDFGLETLPGSDPAAMQIGDDGFIVGSENGIAAGWRPDRTLLPLPRVQAPKGEGLGVQYVGDRHWIVGSSHDQGSFRAVLWRVP